MTLLEALILLSPLFAIFFGVTTIGLAVALAVRPPRRGITRLADTCADHGRCAGLAQQREEADRV